METQTKIYLLATVIGAFCLLLAIVIPHITIVITVVYFLFWLIKNHTPKFKRKYYEH